MKSDLDVQPIKGAFSRKEAAIYLSCSTRYLDKLAKKGELKRCKLGTKTVFLVSELDRFLLTKLQSSSEVEA